MKELSKVYNASEVEDAIYEKWESSGMFSPKIDPKKKPFVISMPPPNATGTLHLGHAVMLALEDILIRYNRMKGIPSLWLPGTDHAGIGTQNKVEQILADEGKTRHDLGREKFIERTKEYVAQSQDTIRNQVRKMGSSCDWTRERYTFDDGLSNAVNEIFVRMYNDGLIYRGPRIVNWCTRCASTLSDDEVEYKEEKTKFYYFKYGDFVIGTARPETKFGDKVVIVHPDDKRYKKYHNKEMTVPWILGDIKAKVIADEVADPEMGSGAMTITPAHSFMDFDLAKKYDLEVTQIIDEEGNMTDAAGEFAGMPVEEARERVVEILEKKGLIDHIDEEYVHNLTVCYRCGTAIQPLISNQWWVDVNKPVIQEGKKKISLKEKAVKVVKENDIEIIPDRFNKTYFHWMENLRDWCISRQIWWGHRIPVWHCLGDEEEGAVCKIECAEPVVQGEKPPKCKFCGSSKFEQDPDTLDTWFSSGLWTFSTLGWPEETEELKYFHPTSVLETGYDILFFWVARMILMSTYTFNEVPFKTVYLHGLVRDIKGRKMSKSLGNGIDPLEMIDKYGTDAVRLALVVGSTPGNDTRISEEKIAGFRNFSNKVWNIARFVLLNLEEDDFKSDDIDTTKLSKADKWILTSYNNLIDSASNKLDNYKLSDYGQEAYDFLWNEFASWYVEITKVHPNKQVLSHVFKGLLKLLQPFMPFVTEAIWTELAQEKMLIEESWPQKDDKFLFSEEAREFTRVKEVISAIRSLRAEANVDATKKIHAIIYGADHTDLLQEKEKIIIRLANLGELEISQSGPKVEQSLTTFVGDIEIYLPLKDLINIEDEKNRLNKELENLQTYLKSLEGKLKNEGFTRSAPPEVIDKEKTKLSDAQTKIEKIQTQLSNL